jgi:GMP synthase (glutamine-hydrolysing)
VLPFLLLATRDHDDAARSEYESVRRHAGLAPAELVHLRLESEPLPPIDLADYSGVILGGSAFNISDETKTPLQQRVEADLASVLNRIVDTDYPFLGLCYGVGAITNHLGGTVDGEFAEGVSAIEVTLTSAGLADPILAGVGPKFRAFVAHKEACSAVPSSVTMLAIGSACPVQMYRTGQNVYVTQFHPELDADELAARLQIYQHAGYFDPAELDALIAMANTSGVDGRQHLVLRNFVQRYAREGGC